MLDMKTLYLAITAIEPATKRGLVVVPVKGSLLDQLTNKTIPFDLVAGSRVAENVTGTERIEDYAETLYRHTLSPSIENATTGVTSSLLMNHSQCFEEAVREVSNAVKRHISFINNSVVPVINSVYESITSKLNGSALRSPVEMLNVRELRKPDFFDEFLLHTDVDKKGQNIVIPKRPPKFSKLELDVEFFTSGDVDQDELMREWYSSLSPEFIISITNLLCSTYMNGTPASTRSTAMLAKLYTYASLMSENPYVKIDAGLLLYIAASKLIDMPERSDVNKTGLSEFEKAMTEIKDYALGLLGSSKIAIDRASRTNELVVSMFGTEILVHSCVYQPWLTKGGSVEVILGVLANADPLLRYVDKINENSEKLLKAYTSYRRINEQRWKLETFSRFKDILELAFIELMQGVTENEKNFILSNPNFLPSARARFEGFLESLKESDIDDIEPVARRLVCRTRFSYTDAEYFLTRMVELSKADKTLAPDEAALLAGFGYVSRYVISQLGVKFQ